MRKSVSICLCASLVLAALPAGAPAAVLSELSEPALPGPALEVPIPKTGVMPLEGLETSRESLSALEALPVPEKAPVFRSLGASMEKPPPGSGDEASEPAHDRAGARFDGSRPAAGDASVEVAPEITRHDGHRIQVKLDVPLVPGKKNVYRIGTYFFVPHALGITPSTYSKGDFYDHIQRRLRFKTPAMSLRRILDESNQTSPLYRTSAVLARMAAGDKSPALASSGYTEIRLLGKTAAVALRDHAGALAALAAGKDPARLPALKEGVRQLVATASELMAEVRALEAASARAPEKIRETLGFLEEFASLSVVEQLLPLLAAMRSEPADPSLAEEDRLVAELIRGEDAARAAAGYPSVVDPRTGSEAMFYRRSVLANFFSSVLELETKVSAWSGAYQVLFGLSAALAALVYALLMQFAQGHLTMRGAALILVGMAAYVVKDRIKDLLKLWTTRRWTRFFADSITAMRDPSTGIVVGKVKETFGFVPRSEVPPEVLRIRQADPLAAVGEDGKPEDVLHYEREVTLDSRAIERYHTRRRNLDDLLLVNLLPFLANTDDKSVEFSTLDPATGKLETQKGTRVHHVNIVTSYEIREPARSSSVVYERRRVVMDRDGIERIEAVPLSK